LRGELLVFRTRDLRLVHDPLADALDLLALVLTGRHGIQTPMNKHPEPRLAKPRHPLIALVLRLLRGDRLRRRTGGSAEQDEQGEVQLKHSRHG
jgi:hypothetical protein